MPKPWSTVLLLPLFVLVTTESCATYEQELQRAEEHFTRDEHEKSLATLRLLESDWSALDTRNRARYCYLRGLTDYRIGFKADARHWLAIAAQIDTDTPGSLVPSEKNLVNEKLAELNAVVWSGDVLPTEEAPGSRRPKKIETTSSEGDPPADDKPATVDEKKQDPEAKPSKKAPSD
ncbi:MAG: hypothetical protein NVS3B20_21650 [Polyangiales bacterium]